MQIEVAGEKGGVTGSTLKLIAIITMFIDHFGAIIVERMLLSGNIEVQNYHKIYMLDMVLRLIGRMAFPIFCFLLVEGFLYTHDVKKYAQRLFLFALISEIPFDIGFSGVLVYWKYQNVFFTLFIGILVVAGFRFVEERPKWNGEFQIFLYALILAAGMGAAALLKTDYGEFGVLTVAVMYWFRKNRMEAVGLGCMVLTVMDILEATSFFIMLPIHYYNGKRGWNMKWLFYFFYPVHILLLYLIACAIGLGQVPMTF